MGFMSKVVGLGQRLSWKIWILIFILLVLISVLPSIWATFNKEESVELLKPVKVLEVKEEISSLTLEYLGIVNARELKKVGFKMAGILGKVWVSEGQSIAEGDILAQLEAKDLELAAEAAMNSRDNAKTAYKFSRDNYEKMKKLLAAGAVSPQESDKARVEMENLSASFNNAEIAYQNKLNNLEDTALKADISGVVADILSEEGEIIPSGYPVAIIRGSELEVNIGISQNDLSKVRIGTPARIIINGSELEGKVASIGQLPDPLTKTYLTTIEIQETTLPIGMTVKLFLDIGEESGIYIPISVIKNDKQDYVYVIDDDMIAHKKVVELGKIKNTQVMVSGLDDGDRIVVEGSRKLYDGDKVAVQ